MGLAAHLKAMMADDLRAVAADAPSVLRMGTRSVDGTASPVVAADDADPAGMLAQADLTFVAALDDFGGALPAVRDVVAVDGVKYWVERIEDDGAAATLYLRRG